MQTEGTAEAVAAACRASCRRRSASCSRPTSSSSRRRSSSPSATSRSSARTRKSSRRAAPLEEKADRAGADLEVQVRVPRQHVARAAHAAQQHPDPRPAARRQPRRQPDAEAGRVRPHHPRRRHRPAEPHQRHPRSVQDRIRHGVGRCRGGLLHATSQDVVVAAVPPRGREPRPLLRRRRSIPSSIAASSPTRSACSRC